MRKLKITLGVLAGLVVLWNLVYPTVRVHYRLTLDVETPEGVKTGSGVIAVYYMRIPQLWATRSQSTRLLGEAVAVDLGERGTMFALLTGRTKDGKPGWPEAPNMLTKVMAPEIWSMKPGPGQVIRMGLMSGKKVVPDEYIPFLVRFRDETDPKTVEAIDPKDLAAAFGPGVTLKSVTIEMVSAGWWPLSLFGIGGEPVTTGIEKRLGWLSKYPEPSLDPSAPVINSPISKLVHHGDFRRNPQ